MTKVFISDQIPQAAEQRLNAAGLTVSSYSGSELISKNELLDAVKDIDFLITTLSTNVDQAIIDNAPKLKLIANFGAGFNNIDIEYARQKNVLVTNTPAVSTDSVVEVTIGLMLALSHRMVEGDQMMRTTGFPGWQPLFFLGREVTNKTLGVIGMGRIGQSVAKVAQALSMHVQYWQPEAHRLAEEREKALGIEYVSFDKLLQTSDVLTIHAPQTNDNFHEINAEAFKQMKDSAILINAARGAIIDEKALVTALNNHEIAGAALDVYEHEPQFSPELKEMKNVILTPHIGNATVEARDAMANICVDNILDFIAGKELRTVN